MQLLLNRGQRAAHRIGARDVAGVAEVLRTGIDQDQLAGSESPCGRSEVQNR